MNPIEERCLRCFKVEPDYSSNEDGLCLKCFSLSQYAEDCYGEEYVEWLLNAHDQPFKSEAQVDSLHEEFLEACSDGTFMQHGVSQSDFLKPGS